MTTPLQCTNIPVDSYKNHSIAVKVSNSLFSSTAEIRILTPATGNIFSTIISAQQVFG